MIIKTLYLGVCDTACHIVSPDDRHCIVIDPAADGKSIYDKISELNLEICAVLLTHGHFDHIYGLDELIKESGNTKLAIYIHEDEAVFLKDTGFNLSASLFGIPYTFTGNVIPFSDGEILSVAGGEFKVMHTPGHTPGSSCFIIENNIFSGDTLFASTIGRTDFPGGSYSLILESLKKLKALNGNYNVYPGHSGATTLNRERKYNEFMQ